MAIVLADAKLNTQDMLDLAVIDEFRKSSYLLNVLPFAQCVSPTGGGGTLTYSYTRHITERGAAFRQQNAEYADAEAKRQRYSVDLAPLGGSFKVDRVLANLGPVTTDEVSYQMTQVIKASVARFHDEFINGQAAKFDQAAPGFDGLDKATVGTVTESTAAAGAPHDWSAIADKGDAIAALVALNKWLNSFDGQPTAIFGSDEGIAKLEELAMWAGYYTTRADEFGREVGHYRGIPLVNLREKAGSGQPIIPTTAGATSLYAARLAEDGTTAVATPGQLINTWLPDFSTSGAVKRGEVELGPVAIAVKKTRSAGAIRIKVA